MASGREVPYEVQVAIGVHDDVSLPNSCLTITFQPGNHEFPQCAMVLALIPVTFGVYRLRYFVSTRLDKQMTENWDTESFSVRDFGAVGIDGDSVSELLTYLEQCFAEFAAFISGSAEVRQTKLNEMIAAASRTKETK